MANETVGVVGLGNMGSGMARSLLRAGFPVVGYDVRSEAVQRLVADGGQGAASLADVGRHAAVVFIVVLDAAQARETLLGVDGLADRMAPGGRVAVCSTISPADTRALGHDVAARGLVYLDAPMSGGAIRAAHGELTMMVGAPADVFAAHRPILDAMAAHVFHCGEVGTGQTAKMCHQLMAGVTFMASAECLALGAAEGLNTRQLWEIVTSGAGDCWMMRNRGIRMLDTYETGSRLNIFAKDLGIVLDAADAHHLPLLLATAARQWFQLGIASGYGDKDDAHFIKVLEGFTGKSVREAAQGA